MQITVEVPDSENDRVLNAFCADRWTEDSGYTEEEYVNKIVGDYVNSVVTDYERNLAVQQAQEVEVVAPIKDEVAEAKIAEAEAKAAKAAKANAEK